MYPYNLINFLIAQLKILMRITLIKGKEKSVSISLKKGKKDGRSY